MVLRLCSKRVQHWCRHCNLHSQLPRGQAGTSCTVFIKKHCAAHNLAHFFPELFKTYYYWLQSKQEFNFINFFSIHILIKLYLSTIRKCFILHGDGFVLYLSTHVSSFTHVAHTNHMSISTHINKPQSCLLILDISNCICYHGNGWTSQIPCYLKNNRKHFNLDVL